MLIKNVVNMNDFRELKDLKRSGDMYAKYLRTLENGQLGTETNYLLEEFSNDLFGHDFSLKVQLVLKEIASRADDEWRLKIEQLNSDTLSLI